MKKEEVADFVEFMIENAADLSEDVGYVKLPDEEYKKDLELIEGLK